MSFFDFLGGMGGLGGGLQDLFKFQQNQPTPNGLPWQNPDVQLQPGQLNQGFGAPTPWQNPDGQPNQQDNLRRMIFMQQLMGQNGGQQSQAGQQPQQMMPVNPPMQSPPPQLPGRYNGQMQNNPQMQQMPSFAQPRIARYLGANRSLGY